MADIPAVCFLDDLARILKTSRRTLEKLRRANALPIPELPSLDKRPRWSGQVVRDFVDGKLAVRAVRSLLRAS